MSPNLNINEKVYDLKRYFSSTERDLKRDFRPWNEIFYSYLLPKTFSAILVCFYVVWRQEDWNFHKKFSFFWVKNRVKNGGQFFKIPISHPFFSILYSISDCIIFYFTFGIGDLLTRGLYQIWKSSAMALKALRMCIITYCVCILTNRFMNLKFFKSPKINIPFRTLS